MLTFIGGLSTEEFFVAFPKGRPNVGLMLFPLSSIFKPISLLLEQICIKTIRL